MINSLRRMIGRRVQPQVQIGTPTLFQPVSQACTKTQMDEPAYAYWCNRIAEVPRFHRKQWEFCYILQALETNRMISPGLKGLGFGVGGEPLSALLASYGVAILATDLAAKEASEKGWVATDQHAKDRESLNDRGICPPELFDQMVRFQSVDMNHIPTSISGYDFCWSACALEHLGSIRKGLRFIERSIDCLKPGGVAVHTTEFNCNSNSHTLDNKSTVLFRKRDFLELADRLMSAGHHIEFNFDLGNEPLDMHIDVAPYSADDHLKLQIEKWVTTSFGLIVRKAA